MGHPCEQALVKIAELLGQKVEYDIPLEPIDQVLPILDEGDTNKVTEELSDKEQRMQDLFDLADSNPEEFKNEIKKSNRKFLEIRLFQFVSNFFL